MKNLLITIGKWSKNHKGLAAYLFTIASIFLIICSFIFGYQSSQLLVIPFVKITLPIAIILLIANHTVFKKRFSIITSRTQFVFRSMIHFLFVIIMFIHAGNANKTATKNVFNTQANATIFVGNYNVIKTDSCIGNNIQSKQAKDNGEYVGDSDKLKFFGIFFLLLLATYFIGALACSIACTGFVVASVFVFYFAFVALVAAFYFLGKSTVSKLKRYRYLSLKQKKKNWIGVFGAGFIAWIGTIMTIYIIEKRK
jgi:hypothetical protein